MLHMDQTTSTVLHSALKRTFSNNTFSTPTDYRNSPKEQLKVKTISCRKVKKLMKRKNRGRE